MAAPSAIPVVALQPLEWPQGQARAVGELFTVQPIEAAALTYQKKARFATVGDRLVAARRSSVSPPTLPVPEPPADPPARRGRGRYRRRDLRVEE